MLANDTVILLSMGPLSAITVIRLIVLKRSMSLRTDIYNKKKNDITIDER